MRSREHPTRFLGGAPFPRHVLMTCDTVGGVWTYALELAAALGRSNVHVTLATLGAPLQADQRRDVGRLRQVDLHESSYALEWMPEPWADVERSREWLQQIAAAVQPDVVHLNTYAHAAAPWSVPTVLVAHSCVFSWWKAVRHATPGPEWRRYHAEVARGIAAADLVVAPTRTMLRAIAEHYGTPAAARVIPNGRGWRTPPAVDRQQYVFAAGRVWDEAKNISMLDRIAPTLDWPVLVAGDLRTPAGGEFRARHLELLGRVPAEEMAGRLARAAIYALPARYEPFGLSVLEAGLAGCALVLGDIPSLRESWEGAAEFVAPDDADGWRRTLFALMASSRACADLADRARMRAARFTPERMLHGYIEAYAAARRARRGAHPLHMAADRSAPAGARRRHHSSHA